MLQCGQVIVSQRIWLCRHSSTPARPAGLQPLNEWQPGGAPHLPEVHPGTARGEQRQARTPAHHQSKAPDAPVPLPALLAWLDR
jgi:hypothetical protein